MQQIVQIFKALSDETRLKILIILSRRKICAKGIAKHLEISEAAVSQHIKILKEAGIIVGEKTGYHVLYVLREEIFDGVLVFVKQLKGIEVFDDCSLSIPISNDCKASCKADRNKCCQKNINR